MNSVMNLIHRNRLEKAVAWAMVLAAGSLDVASWYVALTNGPVVFAIILLHRILMSWMEVREGYWDETVSFFKWLLS